MPACREMEHDAVLRSYNSGPYPLCRYDKDGYVCNCGLSLIEDVYEMFISYRALIRYRAGARYNYTFDLEPMESYGVGYMDEAKDFRSR